MGKYSSMSEAKEIASFLRERINALGKEQKDRPTWTRAVQKSLDEYRDKQKWAGSEVLPPWNKDVPEDSRKNSFLLDFVVWRRDIGGNKEGAWIACESEWNLDSDSIVKDFHKLLSFRAPYKLMIYDAGHNGKLSEKCRKEFEKAFAGFQWHLDDEIYVFVEFVKGDRIARCYTCEPAVSTEMLEIIEKS
jgi:hypothetical protein